MKLNWRNGCLATTGALAVLVNCTPNAHASDELIYQYRGKPVTKQFYQATLITKDAQLLVRNDRLQEAVTRLEKALQLAPDFDEAEANLGTVLLRLGKPREAIPRLMHVIDQGGQIQECWMNLGSAQTSIGDLAAACKTYQTFLQRFPDSRYAAKVQEILATMKREQKDVGAQSGSVTTTGTEASLTDYYKEAVGTQKNRWFSDKMPLKVFIAAGQGKSGYRTTYAEIVKSAFKTWQSAMSGVVRFEFVEDPRKASIVCEWVDDPDLVKNTQKKGETLLTTAKGTIFGAKIKFFIGLGESTVSDTRLKFTSLHEIGHALGLQGHSPHPDDIMFFSTSLTDKVRTLSQRDISTLKRLYVSDYFAVKDVTSEHEKGVTALESKNYAKAIECFNSVLAIRPDLETAKVNLALCYAGYALDLDQERKYKDAESAYRSALKLRKSLAQPELLNSAVKNFASMLKDQGRSGEATEVEKALFILKTDR